MSKSNVEKLLEENRLEGGSHITHISMVHPKGKFQLDTDSTNELWEEYSQLIQDDNVIIGIAEKPGNYLPILADIDIKVKEEEMIIHENDKLYLDKDVDTLISIYQSVIRKVVDSCSDQDLTCVLLEKPKYKSIKGGNTVYVKNGFHLHFPYLFLNKADQMTHIIPRVQEILQKMDIFQSLNLDKVENIIDKSSCTNSWLLYGSRKSAETGRYSVSRIINSVGEDISLEKAFSKYPIYNREHQIKISGKVKEYLPRILSIHSKNRNIKEIKRGVLPLLNQQMKEKKKVNNEDKDSINVKEVLDQAEVLLSMISTSRAIDRNEWISIGWVLFNVSNGSHRGFEIWDEFSSRAEEHYDQASCICEWEKMVKKDLTLGTLCHYARIDNLAKYREYKQSKANKFMEQSLAGSHTDVANMMYSKFGDEFVCASIANKIWYRFNGVYWEEMEEGVDLRMKISDDLVMDYVATIKELSSRLGDASEPEAKAIGEKIKNINKVIQNLKKTPFKNNVMRECMEVFYDRRFKQKLDLNAYLIAFQNGVYDLTDNYFRPGRPEDFISTPTAIEYKEFDWGDAEVEDVLDFLQKIFPDNSLRKYFLDTYCEIFVGGNHQKVVHFWTGGQNNGKTITQTIFESILGKLAVKFNTNLITGKKISAGQANPELSRAGNGVRWASLEEPDNNEEINAGIFKSLSGNDSYYARDLFEKGKQTREIMPMFKMVFICNTLPKFRQADEAVYGRVKVIPFETTFMRPGEPCPETAEEQLRQMKYPMDLQFKKRIPKMLQAFAWLLLEHRKKGVKYHEPEKVRRATDNYRKQNDIYRKYIEENIIETGNSMDKIGLQDLYTSYKEWYKDGFPGSTINTRDDLKKYFENLWGKSSSSNNWKGYAIRCEDDNDIEDDD